MSIAYVNGVPWNNIAYYKNAQRPRIASVNGVVAGGTSASDDFDSYADGSSLAVANPTDWVNVQGSIKVVNPSGNGRVMGAVAGTVCLVRWGTGTWSSDQYAEFTFSDHTFTTNYVGVAVRLQNSGVTGYFCYWTNSTLYINKYNAGTLTGITTRQFTPLAPSAGDIVRLEVTGSGASTRLVVKKNGTQLGATIDPSGTYIDGGNPGIAGYGDGTTSLFGATLWSAADL